MKKIFKKISVGEIIDKLTILEIKKRKINSKKYSTQIKKEHEILKKSLKKNLKINNKIKKLWKELYKVNSNIWDMENLKRERQKILEEIVIVARYVYKYNDERASIKSKINKITKSNVNEVKKYSNY